MRYFGVTCPYCFDFQALKIDHDPVDQEKVIERCTNAECGKQFVTTFTALVVTQTRLSTQSTKV